jgi:hypothetical protein
MVGLKCPWYLKPGADQAAIRRFGNGMWSLAVRVRVARRLLHAELCQTCARGSK